MWKITNAHFDKAFVERLIAALCFTFAPVASEGKHIAARSAASAPAESNCAKPIVVINSPKKDDSIIATDKEPTDCASPRFA